MPHTPTLSGQSRIRSTAAALHAATLSCDSLQHETDERLVVLTRAGSERAFAEITRRYQRPLRAYCSRLVGAERAQDAVQQALLQAFLSLRDRAPREIALRPWLYRIAHNCAVDLLRMGSWEYEQLDLESDGVPQPPALFEQKEELRGLVAGMRRLPEAQRKALALRELEGCSYEEISARLGHSGSGVRQLIFRARSALRKGASAALVPFALIRERLASMTSAVDTTQATAAASVPAHSGGGMETIGATVLAVLAVVGGVAGGVRGSSGDERRTHTGPTRLGVAGPEARAPLAARRVARARPARAGGVEPIALALSGGISAQGLAAAAPLAVAPLQGAGEPVKQPLPPATEPDPPAAPPAGTTGGAGGDDVAIEQQSVTPAGGGASAPEGPAAPPEAETQEPVPAPEPSPPSGGAEAEPQSMGPAEPAVQ